MLSVGPVAAADWEIRAASWQLAAMLEASSNKRICEGKRKKEKEKKVNFILSIWHSKPQLSDQTDTEMKFANTLNQK